VVSGGPGVQKAKEMRWTIYGLGVLEDLLAGLFAVKGDRLPNSINNKCLFLIDCSGNWSFGASSHVLPFGVSLAVMLLL